MKKLIVAFLFSLVFIACSNTNVNPTPATTAVMEMDQMDTNNFGPKLDVDTFN
ncbi:hypothetical protein [uncultured Cetobacterium sp.]|uniref:hypothetical protein n=1 Tax=uncultured Cetobacterium sp. TaxID=527638 RepID=UPI0025E625CC|nr:hypothetical protein [uncultured Cetobacterium sp.]